MCLIVSALLSVKFIPHIYIMGNIKIGVLTLSTLALYSPLSGFELSTFSSTFYVCSTFHPQSIHTISTWLSTQEILYFQRFEPLFHISTRYIIITNYFIIFIMQKAGINIRYSPLSGFELSSKTAIQLTYAGFLAMVD